MAERQALTIEELIARLQRLASALPGAMVVVTNDADGGSWPIVGVDWGPIDGQKVVCIEAEMDPERAEVLWRARAAAVLPIRRPR